MESGLINPIHLDEMNKMKMRISIPLLIFAFLLPGCANQAPQTPGGAPGDSARDIVEGDALASGILERLAFLDLKAEYKNTTGTGNGSMVFYSTNGVINKRIKRGEIGFEAVGGKITRVLLCPEFDCGYAGLQEAFDALDAPFGQYAEAKELLQSYYFAQPPVTENKGKDFLEYDLGFSQMQEQGFVISHSLLSSSAGAHVWRLDMNLTRMIGGDFSHKAHCDLELDEGTDYFSSIEGCVTSLEKLDGTASFALQLPICRKVAVDQALLQQLPESPGNMVPTYCANILADLLNSLE